ncbi:cytochrome c biogenesis factor-like protein [Sphingomonas sp. HITSZ_GF]|uniref:tetratricopeptide repeat protein n=1 Tax=Sphingomonas sp. HITSZ_GF TaxID=3037247 RepID=UPI00240D250B|nr:cytochrome c biogenesis factor-like protein [Sphingomonas sp. HITSZ_GF]MDG2532321.1 cytochrome c biogenesis factor-like protein [Sphingomonas sp. HITSZ_GF]
MMGWAMFAALALVALLALAVLRYPVKLWSVPATAVMLGAAGYTWQGSPALPGHPVKPNTQKAEIDQGLIDLRDAMFGKYGTYAWSYANLADGMVRTGNPEMVVGVWQGAVRKVPEDVALWTGFGTALAEHDGNQVSPAAQLAFDKALALSPGHPGPHFFYGLALVRANRYADALPWWKKAVELTPPTATYRRELELRLIALEMFLAQQQGQASPPAAREGK